MNFGFRIADLTKNFGLRIGPHVYQQPIESKFMEVDHFILCYGRTDFTKFTIDSISNRSKFIPKITLINNGWTHKRWHSFAEDYLKQGKVANIVNTNCKYPLDAFEKPNFLTSSPYYFATDNDCLMPLPQHGLKFDEYGYTIMNENKILKRLGYMCFRNIFLTHFPEFDQIEPNLIVPLYKLERFSTKLQTKKGEWTESLRVSILNKDPRLINMISDTTLSIIRKPLKINGRANRFAHTSIPDFAISHLGYIEESYYTPDSYEETVEYMTKRVTNLTEFATDYENRKNRYTHNVKLFLSKFA